MAVKIRSKPSTTTVKPKTKIKPKTKPLTKAEQKKLECIWPGEDRCPQVNGKDSPYGYQKGCRNEACKVANYNYYVDWRAKKAEEAAKVERKRKRAKSASKRIATKAVNGKRSK